MFNPIKHMLNRHTLEPELLQTITPAETGALSAPRPQLTVATNLPKTADRVQQIQANLANSTRAEFANVIEQLNASQSKNN